MTPAEKRIKDLIDRWLTSIELHLQYVELSDEAYAEIQAWPKHDRPTRWVLELAKQKANDLKDAFESRHQMGDSKFADSLELMSFLSNLVGAQHVERFIPLAEPQAETEVPKPAPKVSVAPASSDVPKWYAQAHAAQVQAPKPAAPVKAATPTPPPAPPPRTPVQPPVAQSRSIDPDATREMPKPRPADPEATREMPRVKQPAPASAVKAEPKKSAAPAKPSAKAAPPPTKEIDKTVIADAVRLIGWGRTWHELAEGIARMADRPPLAEVRKILRAHRATIEKTAKESAK